mgnify:CR=1 FL=1
MRKTHLGLTSLGGGFHFLSLCGALSIGTLLSVFVEAGSISDGAKLPVIVRIEGVSPEDGRGRTDEFQIPVNTDNSFALDNVSKDGTLWNLDSLQVSGNIDPFTSVNYAVTNNAAVTINFTVSVLLPIAPQLPTTLHGGSVGGALTDANNNGVATVATVGGGVPFYQGQIDGSTVLSIFTDPYSLSVAFAGQTINLPAMNPGLPGPTLPSGPALASIGIINRFSLTPGDQFSGNSFFVIEPIPEPGTLVLAGLCLACLGFRRCN